MRGKTRRGGAPVVSTTSFSVNDLPAEERYDVWRSSISCIFDVDPGPKSKRAAGFFGSIDAHMIGSLLLARTRTRHQLWARSATTMARDGMDHYMIQFYQTGSQRCSWRGGDLDMPTNSLLVYDLAQEMTAETTDFTNISLILPRTLLADLLIAPDDHHMRLLDGANPMVALLRDHMQSLLTHAAKFDPRQAVTLAPAVAGLVAACLNSADGGRPPAAATEAALLSRIKRDIETGLTDPGLTVERLCARHDLSRTRIYELFAPYGGVATYIKERRLRAALLDLVDPRQNRVPISAIARRFTFRQSDFSRSFQHHYGLSPRAARHYGITPKRRITDMTVDRRYENWLRDLAI